MDILMYAPLGNNIPKERIGGAEIGCLRSIDMIKESGINISIIEKPTTYYGIKVDVSERDLYQSEIETFNDYNTRHAKMAGKLPIGPICIPSIDSIKAAISPTSHNYYYFVADKNKKTYFFKTYNEHINKINELKRNGLWYEY